MNRKWIVAAVAAGISATSGVGALAQGLDALQGAWTLGGVDCGDTFVKNGSTWQFKDRNSSLNTGLIIEGKKMLGPGATCTIGRVADKGDHLVVSLGCEDAIMFNTVSVSIKIVDDTHFERFDPDFPESFGTYSKCQ
jgi:hypothetical protein